MQKQIKEKGAFKIIEDVCMMCKKRINTSKDNYLSLDSYNNGELIERALFHLPNCWGEYNNQRFNQRLNDTAFHRMRLLKRLAEED